MTSSVSCAALRTEAGVKAHTPEPGREPGPAPDRELPNPGVPPDMQPVVPQQDPPMPGRPGDGEPPPVIAMFRHGPRHSTHR